MITARKTEERRRTESALCFLTSATGRQIRRSRCSCARLPYSPNHCRLISSACFRNINTRCNQTVQTLRVKKTTNSKPSPVTPFHPPTSTIHQNSTAARILHSHESRKGGFFNTNKEINQTNTNHYPISGVYKYFRPKKPHRSAV